jgi:hypothetical protein
MLEWTLRPLLPGWTFDLLLVATLVVGVLVVELGPVATVVASVAAVAVAALSVVGHERAGALAEALELAFFAIVTGALLLRVFKPGRITVHRLLGAIAAFVLLAIDFGIAYQLLARLQPGAIAAGGAQATYQDAMWMSFITLTTVGFGDVLPVSPAARSLAALEALTGVLYPAVLIGKLVGETAPRRH